MGKVLRSNYQKYKKVSRGSKTTLGFLRTFMNEIIFRTSKLEGEPVTRKMVKTSSR